MWTCVTTFAIRGMEAAPFFNPSMTTSSHRLFPTPFQLDLNPSTTLGVRDLWARTDLGNVTTQWTAKALKPHDVQMLKMSFV